MTVRRAMSPRANEFADPGAAPPTSAPPILRRRTMVITAGATTAMYATGAVFAARQATGEAGIWAPISDAAALAFAVSLLPVVTSSAHHLRAVGASSAPVARALGLTATALVIAGSTFLLSTDLGFFQFETPLAGAGLAVQFIGLAALGLWLVHTGVLTIRHALWSRVAGWSAIVAGVGYMAGTIVAALQLFGNPLFLIAYAITISGFGTWLVAMIRHTH